jgi:hypothetical protein
MIPHADSAAPSGKPSGGVGGGGGIWDTNVRTASVVEQESGDYLFSVSKRSGEMANKNDIGLKIKYIQSQLYSEFANAHVFTADFWVSLMFLVVGFWLRLYVFSVGSVHACVAFTLCLSNFRLCLIRLCLRLSSDSPLSLSPLPRDRYTHYIGEYIWLSGMNGVVVYQVGGPVVCLSTKDLSVASVASLDATDPSSLLCRSAAQHLSHTCTHRHHRHHAASLSLPLPSPSPLSLSFSPRLSLQFEFRPYTVMVGYSSDLLQTYVEVGCPVFPLKSSGFRLRLTHLRHLNFRLNVVLGWVCLRRAGRQPRAASWHDINSLGVRSVPWLLP